MKEGRKEGRKREVMCKGSDVKGDVLYEWRQEGWERRRPRSAEITEEGSIYLTYRLLLQSAVTV